MTAFLVAEWYSTLEVPCNTVQGTPVLPSFSARKLAAVADDLTPIRGNVSPRALQGWEAFIGRHGLNTAALIEALGLAFAEMTGDAPLPPFLADLIQPAREIAFRRSRRGRQ